VSKMSTREEKRNQKKVEEMMLDRATDALESEVEDIKSELDSGRMKYNERKIIKRLKSVAEDAVDKVKNELTGSLVLSTVKVGKDFYPVQKELERPLEPTLALVATGVVVSAAAVKVLASLGVTAVAGGLVYGFKDEINDWWEDKSEKIKKWVEEADRRREEEIERGDEESIARREKHAREKEKRIQRENYEALERHWREMDEEERIWEEEHPEEVRREREKEVEEWRKEEEERKARGEKRHYRGEE